MTQIQEISIDLIDHPQVEMRTWVDQEYIESLAQSIKEVGLQSPIKVKEKDGRFKIVFGNCRYEAYKLLGIATIPCIVTTISDDNIPAITLHENLIREDVNHMDTARYLVWLRDAKNKSIDDLARTFRYSNTWIYQHLKLTEADECIRNAVEAGHLNYQAGLELMRIPDENRRYVLLDSAVKAGANLTVVKSWVASELCQLGLRPMSPPITINPNTELPPPITFTCALCLKQTPSEKQIIIRVCADDYRTVMDALKILREQGFSEDPKKEGAVEHAA